jgi:hypothetical protein
MVSLKWQNYVGKFTLEFIKSILAVDLIFFSRKLDFLILLKNFMCSQKQPSLQEIFIECTPKLPKRMSL